MTRKQDKPISSPKFYTIAEVAEFMGNHERTVRRWIERGWLVAHRINRLVRISEPDFLAFLAAHRDD
jgi:excisionase family DNA binding protein